MKSTLFNPQGLATMPLPDELYQEILNLYSESEKMLMALPTGDLWVLWQCISNNEFESWYGIRERSRILQYLRTKSQYILGTTQAFALPYEAAELFGVGTVNINHELQMNHIVGKCLRGPSVNVDLMYCKSITGTHMPDLSYIIYNYYVSMSGNSAENVVRCTCVAAIMLWFRVMRDALENYPLFLVERRKANIAEFQKKQEVNLPVGEVGRKTSEVSHGGSERIAGTEGDETGHVEGHGIEGSQGEGSAATEDSGTA